MPDGGLFWDLSSWTEGAEVGVTMRTNLDKDDVDVRIDTEGRVSVAHVRTPTVKTYLRFPAQADLGTVTATVRNGVVDVRATRITPPPASSGWGKARTSKEASS